MPSDSKGWLTAHLENIPRNQRLWLARAGILLAALLVGFLGIQSPSWKRHRLLEQTYQQEKQWAKLLSAIDSQRKELEKRAQEVFLQGGTSALTVEIARLTAESNLHIELVVPQPQAAFGPYSRVQVRMVASSTFGDLLKFLQRLEGHRPSLRVDHLEIDEGSPAGADSGAGILPSAKSDRHRSTLLISAFSKPEGVR